MLTINELISSNITKEFIDSNFDNIDFTDLCRYCKLSEDIIKCYIDNLNIANLLSCQELSEDLLFWIADYLGLLFTDLEFSIVLSCQKFSVKFLESFPDFINEITYIQIFNNEKVIYDPDIQIFLISNFEYIALDILEDFNLSYEVQAFIDLLRL